MRSYDLIIIGAGPGGYETAAEAAALGKKVAVFEKDKPGGTCLNRGCIPTKCLCAAAERISMLKDGPEFGIFADNIKADYSTAHARARRIVDELREGVLAALAGTDLIASEARLTAAGTIIADNEEFSAHKIIIATGSRPAPLRIDGAEYVIDSDSFLALESLPQKLIIIGGGVIGLEFACIAHSFGCSVTVLEFCKEILPGLDADVAKRLKSILSRKGIEIITDACVTSVSKEHKVTYSRRGKENVIEADAVLAAVGRRPVLPDGLEEAGIALTDRGFINVDSDMRTSNPCIYAIGDVNGICMLAHAASAQGRRALGLDVNLDVIPSVVFTVPECAFVGKPDENDKTIKTLYGSNGKAMAGGNTEGFVKIGYSPETERITSCSILGAHASDLIAEAALAISNGLTLGALKRTVHAHPTLSELLVSAIR